MVNAYKMKESLEVSEIASKEVKKYLESLEITTGVISVEKNKKYQNQDIDFLWFYKKDGIEHMKKIEVKADRYSHTGNFFIETVSNIKKNTPGCFIYSKADYFFYYFIDTKELNIIPLLKARSWFLNNIHNFKKAKTSTVVGNGRYYSWGRLVPKDIMRQALGNITIKNLKVM